ncbi:MAG: CHAT domain-containing protein [Flavobacteriaceae bacterium]
MNPLTAHCFRILGLLFKGCFVGGVFAFQGMAQENRYVHEVYVQRVDQTTLTVSQKDTLLQELITGKTLLVDSIQVAKIYYQFIRECYKTDLDRALFYSDKIRKLGKGNTSRKDDVFERALTNQIRFLNEKGNFYEAIQMGKLFVEQYPNEGRRKAITYSNMARAYQETGDFARALDHYGKSIGIFEGIPDCRNLALVIIREIELMSLFQDDSMERVPMVRRRLSQLDSLCDLQDAHRNQLFLNMGAVYFTESLLTEAEQAFGESLRLVTKTKDSSMVSNSLMNLAICYKRQGNYKKAEQFLSRAKSYAGADKLLRSRIHNNRADIDVEGKKYREALHGYQMAITDALLQFGGLPIESLPAIRQLELSPHKISVLGYLVDKANAWMAFHQYEPRKDYLEYALETFVLADALMDVIYMESREELSKLFWREKAASFYPGAVAVCQQLRDTESAFYFMEKGKAMLLMGDLAQNQANALANLPAPIVQREYQLRRRIKLLESKRNALVDVSTLKGDTLANGIFETKYAYEAFVDSLEVQYPTYHDYKKELSILPLGEVQRSLAKDALVAHYMVAPRKQYVLLVSKANSFIKEVSGNGIMEDIGQLRELLSKPFVTQHDEQTYRKIAQRVYNALLPLQETWPDTTFKKLTIVPDGPLNYLPFETLVNNTGNFLVVDVETNYEYSLSLAKKLREYTSSAENNALAVAPVHFKDDAMASLDLDKEGTSQMEKWFGGEQLRLHDASYGNFMEQYGKYKVVHLSTHAGMDKTGPWLAFYDGKINLDTLFFERKGADLVVLSACNTSMGEWKKGEGVLSLARGFFKGGAKSSIASLWKIDEKSSHKILSGFYGKLREGLPKSRALQEAKREYVLAHEGTSAASPYYWGALILNGDPNPIRFVGQYDSFLILGIILLGVAALYIVFRKTGKVG